MPRSSPARGRPSASRAAEQTQRNSTFPCRILFHADRCSRLRVKAALSKAAWWPGPLTFDLEMVSESPVRWATSVPILVFLGLSVLDLGPIYATDRQTSDRQTEDRQTDVRQKHRLMPRLLGAGHNNRLFLPASWMHKNSTPLSGEC